MKVDNEKDIRTVSVFSGAGGLDIGAIEAGANVIWANDMMKAMAPAVYFSAMDGETR